MKIPILCYHRVLGPNDVTPLTPTGFVSHISIEQFTEQMDILADNGMQAITYEDFIDASAGRKKLPQRPVMIDFDDTRMVAFTNAWPIMKQRGFVGTVFVISDVADGIDSYMGPLKDFPGMTWDELKKLSDNGWCMGAHTKSHFWLIDLCEKKGIEAVQYEILTGKERMEEMLGKPTRVFAYPGGMYNDEIEQIVKNNFAANRIWFRDTVEIEYLIANSLHFDPAKVCDFSTSEYVTEDTDIYRLPCANISCQTNQKDFENWIKNAIE
ncbi:polysaccharide deacetylase family protein [Planctomycetota bacterium]